jgi:hypothetical protein
LRFSIGNRSFDHREFNQNEKGDIMKNSIFIMGVIAVFYFALIASERSFSQQQIKNKAITPEESDVLVTTSAGAVPIPPPGPEGTVMIGGGISTGGPGVGTFQYAVGDVGLDIAAKPVKGAPYSAEATTETVQTLSDGNRIQQKQSSMVYRDSEGRTRREHSVGSIIPLVGGDEPPQLIFINDPVAAVSYVLNPKDHTANKIMLPSGMRPPTPLASGGSGTVKPGKDVTFEKKVIASVHEEQFFFQNFRTQLDAKPETEPLGKRIIEGIEAEGTRSILTIPAGQIGNDLPIQIVSERWYSPELETVILSKHSDPRFAETTYRLTGISRSEPSKSLFEVPADYTVKEGAPGVPAFRYRKRIATGND